MKIECPECKLTGNIDDSTVPATGLAMICPRCKKHFTVEKTVVDAATDVAMLDTCPSCQYSTFSDEKFSTCPKCGLVVADFQKTLLQTRKPTANRQQPPHRVQEAPPVRITEEQRLRDEEARRKHGLDKIQETMDIDEPAIARPKVDTPLPVFIIGWATIVVAILLTVYGGNGIYEYLGKVKEAEATIAALEQAESSTALFFQFLLFPVLSIAYALVILFIAIQFMALKRQFARAMQIGAWGGVILMAFIKLNDMLFWCRRASAEASLGYYAMGLLGDLLIAVVMIAPFLVLTQYFQSEQFDKVNDYFL